MKIMKICVMNEISKILGFIKYLRLLAHIVLRAVCIRHENIHTVILARIL